MMLDHIALYMSDRDEAASFLTTHLGFHVVDHTERYTLVGAGGRLGKLTLFDAPQGTTPSPGEIGRITIRVADPEAAAKELPPEANAEPSDGGYSFTGPEGLPLALVPGEGRVRGLRPGRLHPALPLARRVRAQVGRDGLRPGRRCHREGG